MHSACPNEASPPTPICALGASAGGVKALQDFFAAIPDNLDAAFVVIVHLAPDRPSAMRDILSTRTSMPVHQVEGVDVAYFAFFGGEF